MPHKDVTYDNGATERFYYDVTPYEEAKRMARINRVATFPSANYRFATHRGQTPKATGSKPRTS
jgi:hypothetical protein